MNYPLVSIILPTYNGSKYLRQSIDSCLNQTYQNFELIIVDDCSKDDTAEIIKFYTDPRIQYIRNQQNQRLPQSLNIGFRQAKGQYLTWTSDDNFYLPQAIERMVNCLKQNKGDFVYADLYVFYNDDINKASLHSLPTTKELRHGNCIRACFLYSRKVMEAVGDYDPDMEFLEDYDYWVRIYKRFPMLHLAEPLYYYRHHPKALWSSNKSEIRMAELLFKLKHGFADVKTATWRLNCYYVGKHNGFKLLYWLKAKLFLKNRISNIVENYQSKKINFTQARRKLNSVINANKMNANNTKHFLLLRRLQSGKGWGGVEKLVMEWFAHTDFRHCHITLAVSKGCQSDYAERLAKAGFPAELIEYPFPEEGRFLEKFTTALRFFRQVKPSTIVFLQGGFTDFSLAHALAAFLVTGGRVYMHENLGAPASPEKFNKKYFGLIPSLELWWHKELALRNIRSYFTKKVLAVSQEAKDRLIDVWRYPQGKVDVMYHGVDTIQFSPSPEIRQEMREALGIGENDLVIVSTARLAQVKRLDRLIDAFDVIHNDNPNCWLLIVGNGVLEENLKELAQGKASRDRILFFGLKEDVKPYLKMSDVFVLPSDNEGLSLALLEAMATGLICISTDCTGSSEVITHGQNGFIVEKSTEGVLNALKTVLSLSPQARQQISQAGVAFVRQNFEIKKRINAVLDEFGIPSYFN